MGICHSIFDVPYAAPDRPPDIVCLSVLAALYESRLPIIALITATPEAPAFITLLTFSLLIPPIPITGIDTAFDELITPVSQFVWPLECDSESNTVPK